ncbi:MAG TPA: hypothetical protein VN914_10200 [Polyangia bacterium]|nr:hypothetical protein [Polyangia bacterium]
MKRAVLLLVLGCAPPLAIAPKDQAPAAPVFVTAQDSSPKEEVRMLPAEAYLRTYLQLFGATAPLEVQRSARRNGLFDSWNEYAAALGLPDHRNDLPRSSQTNALMIATFDRLAIALCVRAAEQDLRPQVAPGQRLVFAFAGTPRPGDARAFAEPFDVLHRTFLGYPAALAPPGRTRAFFSLFQATVARHEKTPARGLGPVEAGWAAVCLGLARHPEFHTY